MEHGGLEHLAVNIELKAGEGGLVVEGDKTAELSSSIREARARGAKLAIFGSRSKGWCLARAEGELLGVAEHAGVLDYHPEELVVTARAGTPLSGLTELLAAHGQYLPFEPPRVGGGGTLGGAVAAGLAGPGRPWRGSVRDAVLGVEMLNGLGERLVFGGQVIKNVAGYDLSRLQAGACGTLGLLLSVSLRLLPLPEAEETRALECTATASQDVVRGWARSSLPVTATCYRDGRLYVRLSGAESRVRGAAAGLGGEPTAGAPPWNSLRDRALPCFEKWPGRVLWEVLCPPAAPLPPGECVIEWAGARRWWLTDLPSGRVRAYAADIGGRALAAYGGPLLEGEISRRLKRAFDPDNLLNPGIVRANAAA